MSGYEGPIVDVDVHHMWTDPEEVIQFLPQPWRNFAHENPRRLVPSHRTYEAVMANGGKLLESIEPGFTSGTVYEKLCSMLIDKYRYLRCVLTHNVGQYGGQLNPDFAVAVCRAVNDWNMEYWLERDHRFCSAIVIPTSQPIEAAKEIRRVGRNPRMVSVIFAGNTLGRPFGDPIYDPIYEAAVEMGIHVSLHYGSTGPVPATTAVGGHLPSGILTFSQFSQQAMHYVSSYISSGTFEKHPSLRILIKEYGVAWLPYVMSRLDRDYRLMRAESPWVRKLPSDYIRAHIKLSTQPLEESPDPKQLIRLLQTVDGIEDLLCFSTDWPHWTTDDPMYVARRLPKAWHRKVMCDNACEFFGWEKPAETGVGVWHTPIQS